MHTHDFSTRAQVSLAAAGTVGTLDVVLPSAQLKQHVTHESSVSHAYPYKFIKAALTGVAGLRADLTTQVAIDANGMLKVRLFICSMWGTPVLLLL